MAPRRTGRTVWPCLRCQADVSRLTFTPECWIVRQLSGRFVEPQDEESVLAAKLCAKRQPRRLRIAGEPMRVEGVSRGQAKPRMSCGLDGAVSIAENVSSRGCSLPISLSR